MKIQLTSHGVAIASATLDNHVTASNFAALLPLTLTLKDYEATEKIAQLPRVLSIAGAPKGYTPAPGDISYYAPWGNLALFYRGSEFSDGLVCLGRLDSGIETVRRPGPLTVTLERAIP